ncbi:MAG: hypothetical protein AAFN65_14710, partial [Bacteroidota bacterium]
MPATAHGTESKRNTTSYPGTAEGLLANTPITAPVSQLNTADINTADINIEEQIRFEAPDENGELTREYTFTGSEGDMIVVYTESPDEEIRGIYAVELYSEDGEFIERERNYEKGTDLAEFRGRHRAFTLPSTGTYRLAVFAYNSGLPAATEHQHLLRVRVASDYEQLMVSASDMINADQFEAALDLFSRAIEQRPDQPLPYFGRMFSQAGLALETTDMDENDVDGSQEIYELYQSVDTDVQEQVLADLKMVQTT